MKKAIEIRRAGFLSVAVVHRTLFFYLFLAVTQLYAKSNFLNQSDSNLATFFHISFFFSTFFFFFKYDRAWCECFIAVMTRCNICCTWTFRRYWYCIIFELGGSDDLFLARYNFSLSLLNKKGNTIQVDEQEVSYFRRNLVYLRPRKREKESMDEWACE